MSFWKTLKSRKGTNFFLLSSLTIRRMSKLRDLCKPSVDLGVWRGMLTCWRNAGVNRAVILVSFHSFVKNIQNILTALLLTTITTIGDSFVRSHNLGWVGSFIQMECDVNNGKLCLWNHSAPRWWMQLHFSRQLKRFIFEKIFLFLS